LVARKKISCDTDSVKKKTDAIPLKEVLRPHDAEEAEKIILGIRRARNPATNPRPFVLISAWNGSQLGLKNLADDCRAYFLLGV
jgi:hypothetical protein